MIEQINTIREALEACRRTAYPDDRATVDNALTALAEIDRGMHEDAAYKAAYFQMLCHIHQPAQQAQVEAVPQCACGVPLYDCDDCGELPKQAEAVPKLEVFYGSMPESCGRTNWTAILHKGDMTDGFTIARSEYPHRVRYDADCVRWLIGELDKEPFILDYDGDEATPCHLCGGAGEVDGKPCPGLNFNGTVHNAAPQQKGGNNETV